MAFSRSAISCSICPERNAFSRACRLSSAFTLSSIRPSGEFERACSPSAGVEPFEELADDRQRLGVEFTIERAQQFQFGALRDCDLNGRIRVDGGIRDGEVSAGPETFVERKLALPNQAFELAVELCEAGLDAHAIRSRFELLPAQALEFDRQFEALVGNRFGLIVSTAHRRDAARQ